MHNLVLSRCKSQELGECFVDGFPPIGNDKSCSIKIKKGWRVILYENAPGRGREIVLTADTPNLGTLNFNDITSRIRVEKIPTWQEAPPEKFKILAFSINAGTGPDKSAYWFGLNNNDSRGRILSQAKLGSTAKWMEIHAMDLGNDIFAFKVLNAGEDMYLTARSNKEVHVDKAADGMVSEGAKFKSVTPLTTAPGAKEGDFRSFESVQFPAHNLRHAGYALFVHTNSGLELFKQDASWLLEKM